MTDREQLTAPDDAASLLGGVPADLARRRRFGWLTFLVVLLVLGGATSAVAMWASGTSANVTVSSGGLAAPTSVTVPATSTGSVAVSWTASAGPVHPEGYYVTRTTGSTSSAACGTSASSLTTATSCTDSSVPAGSYTYKVTAVYKSWSATSSASGTVVVSTVTVGKLVFTQNPQSQRSDLSIGNVIVQLQTNSGTTLNTSGVTITVTLSNNTEGATLSGTQTATTGSNGAATFSGLSVDLVGSYTLTATSSSYTSGVSQSFSITAGQASAIVISAGNNQSATHGTTFAKALVVIVTDSEGNPVSGNGVSFTAPTSGASGTFAGTSNTTYNGVSDSDGAVSVTIKANATKGSYHVTASGSGTGSVTFSLTNT